MKNIFYWAPFTSKVATVRAVINSAYAVNRYSSKNEFKTSIIDAVHEWNDYKNELREKEIELISLNKHSKFNSFNKDGFIKSRLSYFYIFVKSFFSLHNLLKKEKPEYLIIHSITSLPLILFIIFNYKTKLILRISGLPKMNFFRKMIWFFASKNLYKITTPTEDTYKDMQKFEFLKKKLIVLNDPVINIKHINKNKKSLVILDDKIKNIINNNNFFLSIGRFTKQKNFIFYLKCIPEILKIKNDAYFIIIARGEEKEKFLKLAKSLNIHKKIFILEYTDNVHFFMRKSVALISTSLWEDPGFVLIESAFNNCTVISSDCPNGPKEIIGENGGYLFKSNSKKNFISAIENFLNDSDKKKFFKKVTLKKRIKKFTCFNHYLNIKKILY